MEEQETKVTFNWKNILIVLLFLGIAVAVFAALTLKSEEEIVNMNSNNINADLQSPTQQDADELVKEDITVGTGDEAVPGKKATVHYLGTLTNGTKFDSSYDRGEPFTFNLGAGEVIQGWDLGVAGMKVGGKRKLVIPSDLGYGNRPAGSIPPNSTLVFEVELLGVE